MKKKFLSLIIGCLCMSVLLSTTGCLGSTVSSGSSFTITNTDELYAQIRSCMEQNITSCSLIYRGLPSRSITDMEGLLNNVYGLKSIKYEISNAIFGKKIKLDMEYWDSDAIIYAYRNSDTSMLTERQKVMYDAYVDILDSCVIATDTDYSKEKAIHDYLVDNITYDQKITSHFNAYEALTQGRAVCAGYAECFRTLMELSGIKCIAISGTAGGENHMWNAVRLEGEWYQVDVTWNDIDNSTDTMRLYNYFNVSDQDMAIDHTITSVLPDEYRSGSRFLYINYENIPIAYDQITLNNYLAHAMQSRTGTIELIVQKGLDVKTAVNSAGVPCTYIISSVERNDRIFHTISCLYY